MRLAVAVGGLFVGGFVGGGYDMMTLERCVSIITLIDDSMHSTVSSNITVILTYRSWTGATVASPILRKRAWVAKVSCCQLWVINKWVSVSLPVYYYDSV